MSHERMAGAIGCVRSVVTRYLQELQLAGLVSFDSHRHLQVSRSLMATSGRAGL